MSKNSKKKASRPPVAVARGATTDAPALACWCGNTDLAPFGPDYAECRICGTLVLRKQLSVVDLAVDDDDSAFYGKQYWLQHQQADLDYPDIYARTRADLPERNLHWLKALLKYRLPPARAVELGCAHGSFVALMQQAGFSASGVEMSPWVVGFAQRTFGIDVQVGPIEAIGMSPGSLDVIALMDVLEHIPDPASTMALCLDLLKDDGLLLIQTPEFREGMEFDRLMEENSSFLSQLKSDEHIYLFSRRSVTEFFQRLGAPHIAFEPAIFAHYDMFLAVSRQPLRANTAKQVEQALMAIPQARIALALLDMKDRFDAAPVLEAEIQVRDQRLAEQYVRADELANARNLAEARYADLLGKYRDLDADREARGSVIASQEAQLEELLRQLHAHGSASTDGWRTLEAQLAATENDRGARGLVIEAQGERIAALEAMVHQRLEELHDVYSERNEVTRRAELLTLERDSLQQQVAASESDRAARLQVIESQGRKLSELEGISHDRLSELQQIYEELSVERGSLQQLTLELDSVKQQFAASEADRAARLRVIEIQGGNLSKLEQSFQERLLELQNTYEELDSARNFSHSLSLELDSLKQQFAESEADRAARLKVIESQGGAISDLQAQMHGQLHELQRVYGELDASTAAAQELSRKLSVLEGWHEASVAELTLSEQKVRELQTMVNDKIAELERARALHLEDSNRLADEIRRRDEAMKALSERLWWKLGKVFRTL